MRLFDEPSSLITDPYLARAYDLARQGRGTTHPNPNVGCVIVRDEAIVGEGYHSRAGEPHAEVIALGSAGSWARGATTYVTLEPCNHEGKTPPCTRALLDAGVDRVVIGAPDPNPHVSGGGAAVLRSAGLEVEFSDSPAVFEAMNEDWSRWLVTGRPWVTVKSALSLDGRMSSTTTQRTRISGDAARSLTMALRARATAVAVGANTAVVDEPHLDLDGAYPSEAQPRRVVIARDSSRVPDVLQSLVASSRPWTVALPVTASTDEASMPSEAAIDYLGYEGDAGIAGVLDALGEAGVVHLLVEAGPGLFTALLEQSLVDELVLYHAGGLLGSSAPAAFSNEVRVTDALDGRFRVTETGTAGNDAVTVWRRRSESTA